MKKLKAIYLLPVSIILIAGLAFAGIKYYITPSKEAAAAARTDFDNARQAAMGATSDYQTGLSKKTTYAKDILRERERFFDIQSKQLDIDDYDTKFGTSDAGQVDYFNRMTSGRILRELTTWARNYRLTKPPEFTFNESLTYGKGLPSVRMVKLEVAGQRFFARGYMELLEMIGKRSGYGYFPMIIVPEGETATAATPGGAMPGGPMPGPGGPMPGGPMPGPGGPGGPAPAALTLAQGAPPAPPGGGAPGDPMMMNPMGPGGAQSGGASSDSYTVDIKVDRNHPLYTRDKPVLFMNYRAQIYFMTKSWDPGAAELDTVGGVSALKALAAQVPPETPLPTVDMEQLPKILFIF